MPAQEGFYSNKIALRRDTQLRRGDAENLAKQSLQLPNHDTCNLMIAAFGADKDVFEVANFGDNKVFIEFEQYSRLIDKKTGKNVKYRTIIFLNPAVDSKELQFF